VKAPGSSLLLPVVVAVLLFDTETKRDLSGTCGSCASAAFR
jgi:hypothetical protein